MDDELISAFGDGWYDGFLAAKAIYLSENDDLADYSDSDVLQLSEHAEDGCQLSKKRGQQHA